MKRHALFLLALTGVLAAQQWSVQLLPPPPEQFFAEQMWNCTVTNPEGEAVDIRLYGWITHEGAEIAHARSNVITVPPGAMRITSADIKTVSDEWYDPAYEDVAERRGALPAGVYTYCLRVEDESGLVLAQDCGEHRGVTPSPPKLLAPPDGSEVTDPYPTFVWTPPAPPPPEVTYELRIVEVPEEMTPEEAISAAEPWFEEDGITATTFLYPMDARPLEEDKEFAWQVTAWVTDIYSNASEVWEFVFQLRSDTTEEDEEKPREPCPYKKEGDWKRTNETRWTSTVTVLETKVARCASCDKQVVKTHMEVTVQKQVKEERTVEECTLLKGHPGPHEVVGKKETRWVDDGRPSTRRYWLGSCGHTWKG